MVKILQEQILQKQREKLVQRQEREREKLINEIRSGMMGDIPAFLKSRGLISEDPQIKFQGRNFLFTGKLTWGSREQATRLVRLLGGNTPSSKSVSSKIDYLVLGEDAKAGWARLASGGKLTDAVCRKLTDEHSQLCIVLESDFIITLVDQLRANQTSLESPPDNSSETRRGLLSGAESQTDMGRTYFIFPPTNKITSSSSTADSAPPSASPV